MNNRSDLNDEEGGAVAICLSEARAGGGKLTLSHIKPAVLI